MDIQLANRIEQFKKELSAHQVHCSREKDINYGHQIVCMVSGEEATVNFYHGKKGISVVVQGKDSPLKLLIRRLASGETMPEAGSASGIAVPLAGGIRPADVQRWIGCDESGKGDVFGPLVGAACLITSEEEKKLQRMGVCDSKLLTDKTIARLAPAISDMLGSRCVIRVLMPKEYNIQYEMLRADHKNLNHLLGNLHAGNIRVLLSKYECPCIIVDKFGKDEYVLSGLRAEAASHQIIQVPRGERDAAVAAASILARQAFVDAMAALSDHYGMTFPKGAFLRIEETIRTFRDAYGNSRLADVGKLNFKTFDFLR